MFLQNAWPLMSVLSSCTAHSSPLIMIEVYIPRSHLESNSLVLSRRLVWICLHSLNSTLWTTKSQSFIFFWWIYVQSGEWITVEPVYKSALNSTFCLGKVSCSAGVSSLLGLYPVSPVYVHHLAGQRPVFHTTRDK